MPHARFIAAVLSVSTAGAVCFGVTLAEERSALAAPRRTLKPLRRTASTTTSDAQPSAPRARRSNDAKTAKRAGDGGQGKAINAATAPALAARGSADPASGAIDAAKGAPEPVKAEGASRRPADHPTAAKVPMAPTTAPSNAKSTAEKFAPEGVPPKGPAGDVSDPAREGADPVVRSAVQTAARREPTAEARADAPDGRRNLLDARREAALDLRRDTAPLAVPATAARPVVVSLDGPVFDGGEVPRAAAALERMKGAFARCATTETALTKNEGTIDLRFLVRAPGRAEGVDVEKSRGVSGDVVRCVASVVARSYIGAPSDEPVGVAVTVRVRKD